MTRSRYAINAENLLNTRLQGLRPAGPVNVALLRREFYETVLYVDHATEPSGLDWRMLTNLQVVVWSDLPEISRAIDVLSDIAQAKPSELSLRVIHGHDLETHDIDVGSGNRHPGLPSAGIPPVNVFTWWPINSGGTRLGRRITQALCKRHPARKTWT